ncbi:MAG: DUF4058 family protein [Planctomycetes bacterium]|nr:DUF4058 family protein [Planctomycetota bacterium]
MQAATNSPFPGMDPYLEDPAFWRDFHLSFVYWWREAIAELLPDPYEARLDESVNLVQMSPEVVKLIFPDVALSRGPRTTRPTPAGGTALLEPVVVPHEFLEEVRQARVEILHRPDRSLVTVLELLSPTNKMGDGFLDYRNKRKAILRQKVHLVELDLLSGGERLPHLVPLPHGDYYTFVSRVEDRLNCEVYHWSARDPLPTIPVPLRAPDADIHIDLKKVFDIVFARGRYARSLRYEQPCPAPLSEADRQWAAQLAAAGIKAPA